MEDYQKLLPIPSESWLKKFCRVIAICGALITLLYGMSILFSPQFSYFFHSSIASPDHVMSHDSAFSFCIASIGLLGVHFRKNYVTLFSVIFLISITILTIIQYLLNQEWDMVHRVISLLVTQPGGIPGKMKPITLFCFLLTAMAMVYLIQNEETPYQKFIFAAAQSVIIICLTVLFIFGFSLRFENLNHINFVFLMTSNAAVGFVLLSTSLFFTVIYFDKKSIFEFSKSLPIMIAAFIAVLNLITWRLLKSHEQLVLLLKRINWLTTVQEIVMILLISIVIYFFQKTYLYHKNFKKLYAMTKATLNATQEGILVIDFNGQVVDYNDKFSNLWNFSADNIRNCDYRKIFDKIFKNLTNFDKIAPVFLKLKENPKEALMCEMQLKNGKILEFYSYPQQSSNKIIGYVYSFHDITHLKHAEEKLLFQATHDVLTNLPNRFLLYQHIEKAIEHAKRRNSLIAILFIDLDGFKLINDSLSHIVGDKVLKSVADRFLSCTRSEDTLTRVGGDEFILLAVDLKTKEDAKIIADKYLQKLVPPFYIENHELHIRCSIGISVYPNDGKNFQNIVENADIAMYFAKKDSQHVHFYTQSMHDEVMSRLRIENELPHAIEENQLQLYYQPIIDIATNKICDTEALIRWNHPTHGLLTPATFIHIAEETGIINAIGSWVLQEACLQNKRWQEKNILTARISVNLSIKQLQKSSIIDEISNILKSIGLNPEFLQLELTESRLIPNIEKTADMLKKLKMLGLKIAIDDFGTGYTGLGYLKQFPLDKLKIDQSFIRDFPNNRIEKEIVVAMVSMCKKLNINACVEGVETKEQYQFLKEQSCQEAQGYFFSHPLSAQEYEHFISEYS